MVLVQRRDEGIVAGRSVSPASTRKPHASLLPKMGDEISFRQSMARMNVQEKFTAGSRKCAHFRKGLGVFRLTSG
jgi:hypothetical protein